MLKGIKEIFIGFCGFLWVTLVATLMANTRDIGGAEISGFLAFLLWIVFAFLIVKNHTIISCILSTSILLVAKISKFGMDGAAFNIEALAQLIGFCVVGFLLYKLFLGNSYDSSKNSDRRVVESNYERSSIVASDQYDNRSYQDVQNVEKVSPQLASGSNEYWEYENAAESIYRDFCHARNTDERRYHKSRGDKLKIMLLSEYGSQDQCVRYIIDTYLDLRV